MRTVLWAGRGTAHLNSSSKVVRVNIKVSNVLLHLEQDDAAVSDIGLNFLLGTSTPPNRVAGSCAPEVVKTPKAAFKSDIYNLRVLLLELLTGKVPTTESSFIRRGREILPCVSKVKHCL